MKKYTLNDLPPNCQSSMKTFNYCLFGLLMINLVALLITIFMAFLLPNSVKELIESSDKTAALILLTADFVCFILAVPSINAVLQGNKSIFVSMLLCLGTGISFIFYLSHLEDTYKLIMIINNNLKIGIIIVYSTLIAISVFLIIYLLYAKNIVEKLDMAEYFKEKSYKSSSRAENSRTDGQKNSIGNDNIGTITNNLIQLKQMEENGLITSREFEEKKKQILKKY